MGRRALKLMEDIYNRDAPVSLQVSHAPTDDIITQSPPLTMSHFVSTEGSVPFLWLRLLQTSEGHLCEERILPESVSLSHLSPPVPLVSSC